jgi:hypothetical protein
VNEPREEGRGGAAEPSSRELNLRLGEREWEAVDKHAEREGVSADDLVAFCVLYYVADLDSGRISRPSRGAKFPRIVR